MGAMLWTWSGLRRLKNLLVLLLGFAYVDLILLGQHLPTHWSEVTTTHGPWSPNHNDNGHKGRRRRRRNNSVHNMQQESQPQDTNSPFDNLPSSASSSLSSSPSIVFTHFQSGVAQWENSTVLPQWLKQYIQWHYEQRSHMNARNWRNYRFAIMQCAKRDDSCGGTADRLKPFLLALLVAHQTQRLLFIKWEVPKPLEDFLLPPLHGIDWRLPPYVEPTSGRFAMSSIKHVTKFFQQHNYSVDRMNTYERPIFLRLQSFDGGAAYYNEQAPDGLPFLQVYRAAWNVMFTPIPDISARIQQSLQEMNLIPGHYTAAHVRAWYKVETRTELFLQELSHNALNCASQLEAQQPHFLLPNNNPKKQHPTTERVFYVASDSGFVVKRALEYGPQQHASVRVVARTHQAPPLHLEKADHPEYRNSSEYYDIFVDLYVMALSQCVTYNKGGFGQLAHMLSYNVSCYCLHHYNKLMKCNWTNHVVGSTQPLEKVELSQPIFALPMPDLRPLRERQPIPGPPAEEEPSERVKGVPKRNIVGRSQVGELLHTY